MCGENCKHNDTEFKEPNDDNHILCAKGNCVMCETKNENLCSDYENAGETLAEAIDKYGDKNLSYYNDMPINALGIVTENPCGMSIVEKPLFKYSFHPFWVTK